jgi:hypothetical protein
MVRIDILGQWPLVYIPLCYPPFCNDGPRDVNRNRIRLRPYDLRVTYGHGQHRLRPVRSIVEDQTGRDGCVDGRTTVYGTVHTGVIYLYTL